MSMNEQKRAFDAKKYKAFADLKPANAVPPITYGAHSTDRNYGGNNMHSPRGNADDNLQHASLNTGAQITRVGL